MEHPHLLLWDLCLVPSRAFPCLTFPNLAFLERQQQEKAPRLVFSAPFTPHGFAAAPPAALGILWGGKVGMRRSRVSSVPPGAGSRCFLLAWARPHCGLWDDIIPRSRISGGYELMSHPIFHSSSSVMGSFSLLKAPGGGKLYWRGKKV